MMAGFVKEALQISPELSELQEERMFVVCSTVLLGTLT
jgi:hypothetical protein